jgi:light-regulated signal transduction histidine kinase (bacteriophytochrome)
MTTDIEIDRLRKALEAETRRCLELQVQLNRANAEFEEFISLAAHDLRESLRDVAAYTQLLAEANTRRSDADPDTGAFLARIRDGAAKMDSLLTDVVDYGSIGACGQQAGAINMEEALNQALLRVETKGAVVTHAALPNVCGDFDVLTKVLHHLIRNAIEYCDRTDPRVHVSSERRDMEWVIGVQDNGPGIDPAYLERIFGAFQRLHGRGVPTNGLGLTFCRKAIERQGGRMWVESTPGAGATFYFTLPVRQPEE